MKHSSRSDQYHIYSISSIKSKSTEVEIFLLRQLTSFQAYPKTSTLITYFMRLFRRKEIPWEVVDSRSVDPVYMYFEDESEGTTRLYKKKRKCSTVDSFPIDFQIVAIGDTTITRTYLLDVKGDTRQSADLRKAVVFAREQLLQEVKKNGYNMLWLERYYLPYFFLEFNA